MFSSKYRKRKNPVSLTFKVIYFSQVIQQTELNVPGNQMIFTNVAAKKKSTFTNYELPTILSFGNSPRKYGQGNY